MKGVISVKKGLKRSTTALLCSLMLTIPVHAAEETVYTDVPPGAWYEEAVMYCRENGLLQGTGDGRFSPEGKVTRGMLAAVLYRLSGSPAVTEESAFDDVEAGAWYAEAVCWVSQGGVMGGYGDGRFGPGDAITREQLAAVLWRLAGSPEVEAEAFADREEIAAYARPAVD